MSFLICTAIWAFAGAAGSFWPVWLLLLPLIAIVRNGWRLYGPAPDLDGLEEELAKKRRREEVAKRVCARCPVLEPCREHALAAEDFGVWGGLSAHEREELRATGQVVTRAS